MLSLLFSGSVRVCSNTGTQDCVNLHVTWQLPSNIALGVYALHLALRAACCIFGICLQTTGTAVYAAASIVE